MKKLIFLFLLLITNVVHSQIITTLDSISSCPPNQVIVSVRVKNFTNVASISIGFKYNQNALSYVGYQNMNPALYGIVINNSTIMNPYQIRAAWYTMTMPATLSDSSILFQIKFNHISSYSDLVWDTLVSTNCQYTDVLGNPYSAIFENGIIYPSNLNGYIKYYNSVQSPINMVKVYVKQNNTKIDSTFTNSSGYFHFTCLPSGQYNIVCVKDDNWSGGNSADALIVAKHSVGMLYISDPLQRKAGDCNGNGYLNSGDCLLIMKKSIGSLIHFPNGINDWVFDEPITVNLTSNTITSLQIKGLCVGDVDGSYIP